MTRNRRWIIWVKPNAMVFMAEGRNPDFFKQNMGETWANWYGAYVEDALRSDTWGYLIKRFNTGAREDER